MLKMNFGIKKAETQGFQLQAKISYNSPMGNPLRMRGIFKQPISTQSPMQMCGDSKKNQLIPKKVRVFSPKTVLLSNKTPFLLMRCPSVPTKFMNKMKVRKKLMGKVLFMQKMETFLFLQIVIPITTFSEFPKGRK